MKRSLTVLVVALALYLAGCTGVEGPVVQETYQIPVPEATLAALDRSGPVETGLQAVAAAQDFIPSARIEWVGSPAAFRIEKLDYAEAMSLLKEVDPAAGGDPVWLVVFEGRWTETAPSGETGSPRPGCVYAVIDAGSGEGIAAGGFSCEGW